MKLRYFYKINHNKQPIPGSNVRRKSRPGFTHQWKEILDPCCTPSVVECTCGPRFFVQLDGSGKPIDHTLIKRSSYPEMDGARYYEISWKSPCCDALTWNFEISNTTGSFVITVNGNEVVNDIIGNPITSLGKVPANIGDTIEVTVTNTGFMGLQNSLQITGGHTFSDSTNPVTTYSFVWNGKETFIYGYIESSEG